MDIYHRKQEQLGNFEEQLSDLILCAEDKNSIEVGTWGSPLGGGRITGGGTESDRAGESESKH